MPDDHRLDQARSLVLSDRREEALAALEEMLAADPDRLGALQLKAGLLLEYASLVEQELAEAEKERC